MLSFTLMIIGAVIAGSMFESFQAGVFGAIVGWLLGGLISLKSRLQALEDDAKAKMAILAEFRSHFDQVTLDIHTRLSKIEKPATTAPPTAPVVAVPIAIEQPVDAPATVPEPLQFDELAILAVPPEQGSPPPTPPQPEIELTPLSPADSQPDIEQATATAPQAQAESESKPASVAPAYRRTTQPTHPVSAEPDWLSTRIAAFQVWLFGGNTVLRVGILLLFLGLAFLLRYAAERVVVPVELRYAGVAFTAIVLLVIGWRVRLKQAAYGLAMQGAGVAVMYLTVFAAMRLHPLLTPQTGFVLLIIITICAAILAILQDALGLAVAGTLGGFAAPILASTGSGNHVALFSYFALLNTGIFAIAWFKAWRLLNLVGFVGTFGIGGAWGLRSYRPELFASTEPFLILFFAMYLAIGLLFARRTLLDAGEAPSDRAALLAWSTKQANYVDGTILFGTPLIGFGLQYAVVRHLEFGAAFSALAMGLAYLILASVLHHRSQWRHALLMEILLALGVIFGTLAIPLGLDARWTSAAWAVEGAGIYWVGLRQQRPVARGFALCLQLAASLAYLSTLYVGTTTLLDGATLGAIMLGGAWLFSYWQLRQTPAEQHRSWENTSPLALMGLAAWDLVPALLLDAQGATMAWALLGLATLYAGLRLQDRSWLPAALGIQALAGIIFLSHLQSGTDGTVLASGWRGVVAAGMLGLATIAGLVLAMRDPVAKVDPLVMKPLGFSMLFGLVFINMAVLFVTPWNTASAVWAVSGLGIVWLSVWLKQRWSLVFGLALQVVGGAALMWAHLDRLVLNPELPAFGHIDFWAPITLGVAAYIGAWRLWQEAQQTKPNAIITGLREISAILLVWATGWWAYAWVNELWRLHDSATTRHLLLILLAGTALVWQWAARRWSWRDMATLCALIVPASALILLIAVNDTGQYHPLASLGWLGWGLVIGLHFYTLRKLDSLLPSSLSTMLHVGGLWLWLLTMSVEMRFLLLQLSEHHTAWRWLGGVLVPAAYLVMATSQRLGRFWPISQYENTYRNTAALPVAAVMFGWFWLSNLASAGAAAPLPYLPLLNPLEIGQLLVLTSVVMWLQARNKEWSPSLPTSQWQWVVGFSLWLMLTCAVFRGAHHLAGVPFQFDELMASMLVQASLSLVWSLAALGLMIAGHARAQRQMWMVGATLAAIVVGKLFLVELGNRGGLARIVSFIGVGVLLLIVGYFAPLPPKTDSEVKEDKTP
ncbi:DUF2339 domain-containing protein [Chitinivorax sp. B]|uniref:DUF2339 domain-containing protein n=1 Tax=Chitinivorax sp. B TaxID=2502235 RepID=UPI002016C42C|nr:DUF2339 domain-containing protein [Chitinivorax sp. B]